MEAEKQQKMAEYIQSMAAIEDCMRPYREQRKELTQELSWKIAGLAKTRFLLAMKAFRMWEQQIDFDNFTKIFEAVETGFLDRGGEQ